QGSVQCEQAAIGVSPERATVGVYGRDLLHAWPDRLFDELEELAPSAARSAGIVRDGTSVRIGGRVVECPCLRGEQVRARVADRDQNRGIAGLLQPREQRIIQRRDDRVTVEEVD